MNVDSSFITPLTSWKEEGIGASHEVTGSGEVPFGNVFRTAIDQVKTTQADVENKQYLLATGQLDDAHSLPIAEAKAQVSLQMMISLRNKALESYNELIKMSI